MNAFEISSTLTASAEAVWSHAVSPAGINAEFRPFFKMTFPAEEILPENWVPGEKMFRSWMLLFGILPVEYDDIAFVEFEPGKRFLERSRMFSQRAWQHERVVEPDGGGCTVVDRVEFEPRLGWMGAVYSPVFRLVFRWRHRNLRRIFGERR